jgi:hypothetical protein
MTEWNATKPLKISTVRVLGTVTCWQNSNRMLDKKITTLEASYFTTTNSMDSRTDEKILRRIKEKRNTPHTRRRRGIGQILRRNFLLKHVIEGKIEGLIEVR